MPDNPFDQFDAPKAGNPFDAFDSKPEKKADTRSNWQKVGDRAKQIGGAAAGVGEAALSAGSGMLSTAAGIGVGMGVAAREGDAAGLEAKRNVQEAGTYQPRTEVGKGIVDASNTLMTPVSKASEALGGAAESVFHSPLAGDIVKDASGFLIGKKAGDVGGKLAGKAIGDSQRTAPKRLNLSADEAPRQAALQAAVKEGYAVHPKDAPAGGLGEKELGSWGGKYATNFDVIRENQPVTNRLARKELGITKEEGPISPDELDAVRAKAGKAYESIKRLGTQFVPDTKFKASINAIDNITKDLHDEFPESTKAPKEVDAIKKDWLGQAYIDPEHAIEMTKQLRKSANDNMSSQDGVTRRLGAAQKKAATAVEDLIERSLSRSKQTQLLEDFRDGRKKIAQSYDVQKAMDPAGNVDAIKIAKKKDKVTGELSKIADFAANFPQAARLSTKLGGKEPHSLLDMAAMLGHNPKLAAAAALRPIARGYALGSKNQNRLANPQTNVGPIPLSQAIGGAAGAVAPKEDE